jgi:hypothetical protein
MTQVLEEQEKELAALERDTQALLNGDVAAVNERARTLGLSFVQIGGQVP